MGLDAHEKLALDHQRARDHIDKYKTAITNGLLARITILSGAIQDFNTWRDMPEQPSSLAAIWDFAFAIVSAAVPAFKLAEALKKSHDAAEVALKAAEIFKKSARVSDKAVKIVGQVAPGAGKAAKHFNEAKDIFEKAQKINPEIKEGGIHASRGPIHQLVKDIYAAPKTWETAIEAETQEWENRMADLPPNGGSLESKMREMLPLPEELDTDEIWKFYLFEMIVAYCQKNCYWEQIIYWSNYGYRISNDKDLKGINGTQLKKIVEFFGPGTARGKYFKRPYIFDVNLFPGLHGLPTRQRRQYG